MNLLELSQLVEKAKEGSRLLDAKIYCATHGLEFISYQPDFYVGAANMVWIVVEGKSGPTGAMIILPYYTTDEHDAMSLALRGVKIELSGPWAIGWLCSLSAACLETVPFKLSDVGEINGASAALTLTAAFLRASHILQQGAV